MVGVENVAGDRRLRRQSVEESLVKPEQQPVDLGLVAVVTVGHITLEFSKIDLGSREGGDGRCAISVSPDGTTHNN